MCHVSKKFVKHCPRAHTSRVVVYRSLNQDQSDFNNFTINFELLFSKLHAEDPYCVIIMGDFNCRSTQWWENDSENIEGTLFEQTAADIGLHQLISEPNHLVGDSKSCIDLIFTDHPNLIIDCGVHPSLHSQCHHQIIYGRLSVSNNSLPPYTHRIWHYDKADFVTIRKCIEISCPNEQVKLLDEVLLNIYSTFVPNQIKMINPRQALWITQAIRKYLRKMSHAYKTL